MNIKNKLTKLKKNPLILWIWNETRRVKGERNFRKISDEEFTKKLYYSSFGKYPNLENPQTFNEKLHWLKLNYRNELMVICSDKYKVREYLEKKGYGYLLNDLIGVYYSVNEIDINRLPEKFVLKGAHGSGWNLIVHDKNKIKWFPWRLVMKSWMKQNLYYYGREWNYRDIKPSIVCERYLEDSNGELIDYKFYCFNGQPKLIQVDIDRFGNHSANYYDDNWNYLNIQWGDEKSYRDLKKPINFEEMLEISKDLSSKFPHVRVDFYEVDGKLYLGELTFFSASGTARFQPDEYDSLVGSWLQLPKNNNVYKSGGEIFEKSAIFD